MNNFLSNCLTKFVMEQLLYLNIDKYKKKLLLILRDILNNQ